MVEVTSTIDELRRFAEARGIARLGVAPVTPLARGRAALERWLERGDHSDLSYMVRAPEERADPRSLLPGARAAVVIAACYTRPQSAEPAIPAGAGRLARYARGDDYHRVLREHLAALAEELDGRFQEPLEHRPCVDTSPLLERELAMTAGLGFIGKNTMLLSPGVGSYTVLGVLLTSAPLPPTTPSRPRCGSCRLCLDACPTGALRSDGYRLDAGRCISALTIERGGAVDETVDPDGVLRRGSGPWVFGCDACQEVCPYNRPTPASATIPVEPRLDTEGRLASVELTTLLTQRSGAYRRLVRGKAMTRASRPQLARNAAFAAATLCQGEIPALDEALESAVENPREEVAHAARWAIHARRPQDPSES